MVQDVVIVGGGLAGLACAVALGDRARSWIDAASGDTIDLGPHVLHSEYRNMLAFLQRLGTRGLVCWQPEKLITLATQARPVALSHRRLPPPFSLLPDLVAGSGLSARDLWSNNRPTWRAMQFDEADVAELDRISAADYLRAAGVSERMIEWFWAFAALAVLNVPLERCSAAALLRVHSQLIEHRRLHFGLPAVGLSELFAPQAAQAVRNAGGQILLGTQVVAIKPSEVILPHGVRIAAAHVVAALPPQALQTLGIDTPSFEPSPYISCYLWFDRKLTAERFWAQPGALQRTGLPSSMESAVRSGWLAAEEVLRAAGRPRQLALAPRPTEGLAGLVRRLRRRRAARAPAWRAPPTARPRPRP
jgi:15-cis-phytoene desaturase